MLRSPADAVAWNPMAALQPFRKTSRCITNTGKSLTEEEGGTQNYSAGRSDQMTGALLAHRRKKAFWCSSINFTYRI